MLVILGAGYAGRFIYAHAAARGIPVMVTSRLPDTHLKFASPSQRLHFDLKQDATWSAIPAGADLIWCFPAMPLESVSAFAKATLRQERRVIVFGSTSAYAAACGHADILIDESAAIDHARPRVLGEEYLRTHCQAIVLRVAGIYGPGRNVLDWIRRGKIGSSERYVNLIHVEDLAALSLLALEKGSPGDVYNVSDGRPRRWSEICAEAQQRWGVTARKNEDQRGPGKRLSIEKLRRDLAYEFQYPDLYAALAAIESVTSSRVGAAPPE